MATRDEIAKGAFEAMLSNPSVIESCLDGGRNIDDCVGDIAALSVRGADALAAEMAKGGAA